MPLDDENVVLSPEVLRRLGNALTYSRFPRFMKPADLLQFWENYAEPETGPTQVRRGMASRR